MRWIKPNLRSSVYSLLGGSPPPVSDSVLQIKVEHIRQAMMECIGDFGQKHYPHVSRRIRYAGDIQALWYLRGDVMSVLSATGGETVALEKIHVLTAMFDGMLPGGLNRRPNRLTV